MNTGKVGESIKAARVAAGMTQDEAASVVAVSQPAISAIEAGKKRPSLAVLVAMADGYRVTIDALIGREMHAGGRSGDSDRKTRKGR